MPSIEQEIRDCELELKLLYAEAAVDAAGIIDPTPCSDLVGAGLALRRGDYTGATLSLLSTIPFVGDAVAKTAKGARLMARIHSVMQRLTQLRRRLLAGRRTERLHDPPQPPPRAPGGGTLANGLRIVPLDEIPRPHPGTVRVYRGTAHPDAVQVSSRQRELMRQNPNHQPPSGDQDFLFMHEANYHAGSVGHPDAVSVTTQLSVATGQGGYGTHVIAYDIPQRVFDQLPNGDPVLAEKVFKHSVPQSMARVVARTRTSSGLELAP